MLEAEHVSVGEVYVQLPTLDLVAGAFICPRPTPVNESVRVTPDAAALPALVTVMVKATACPVATGFGDSVTPIDTGPAVDAAARPERPAPRVNRLVVPRHVTANKTSHLRTARRRAPRLRASCT